VESVAFWAENFRRSDTLLHGRVAYELMKGAWRRPKSGEWPDWMDASEVAFSEVMDPIRKVVASGTLDAVDWNAELISGNVVEVARAVKERPGRGIALGASRCRRCSRGTGSSMSARSLCTPWLRGGGRDCSTVSTCRSS